MIKQNP